MGQGGKAVRACTCMAVLVPSNAWLRPNVSPLCTPYVPLMYPLCTPSVPLAFN